MIINAPDPVTSLSELTPEQVTGAMEVWRERMRTHSDAAYVHLIVNEQREAGASLPHSHAQLYALDFVPAAIARERERFGAYATRTMGSNLLGDLVQEEVRRRERVVAIDDEAVLLAPFASRVPYQLMLAPRRPRRRFEEDGPTGDRQASAAKCAGNYSCRKPNRRRTGRRVGQLIGHQFDYQWRKPWMNIKGVKVNSLEPTIIRLKPQPLK